MTMTRYKGKITEFTTPERVIARLLLELYAADFTIHWTKYDTTGEREYHEEWQRLHGITIQMTGNKLTITICH